LNQNQKKKKKKEGTFSLQSSLRLGGTACLGLLFILQRGIATREAKSKFQQSIFSDAPRFLRLRIAQKEKWHL
jgi:hypothetical protein